MSEALLFQEQENVLYLKAQGHITALLCAGLRERVFSRLDSRPLVTAMYVDLSDCDYMDSTFMGLLVGFNKRLIRMQSKKLIIVQASQTARKLLSGLGLDALVDFVDHAVVFPENMQTLDALQKANTDLLIKAHENLMEISDENKQKFSGLHEVLKKQQKEEQ